MSIRILAAAALCALLPACNPAAERPADEVGAVETPQATPAERAKGPTAMDQSGRSGDIALTAAIRREILTTDELSARADNVQIITRGGIVTLRGAVASQQEHDQVVAIAERIAGAGKVKDEIEVRTDGDVPPPAHQGHEG